MRSRGRSACVDALFKDSLQKPAGLVTKPINLGALATALNASVPTLRRAIRDNADFPVARRGSKGNDWLFDLAAARAWWTQYIRERPKTRGDQILPSREREGVRPGVLSRNAEPGGLSISQRKTTLETALLADRLKKERGELVEVGPLRAELESDIVAFRTTLNSYPAEMAKLLGLSAEAQHAMQEAMERRLNTLADKFGSKAGGNGAGGSS